MASLLSRAPELADGDGLGVQAVVEGSTVEDVIEFSPDRIEFARAPQVLEVGRL